MRFWYCSPSQRQPSSQEIEQACQCGQASRGCPVSRGFFPLEYSTRGKVYCTDYQALLCKSSSDSGFCQRLRKRVTAHSISSLTHRHSDRAIHWHADLPRRSPILAPRLQPLRPSMIEEGLRACIVLCETQPFQRCDYPLSTTRSDTLY